MQIGGYFRNRRMMWKPAAALIAILIIASLTIGCISSERTSQSSTLSGINAVTAVSKGSVLFDEDVVTSLYEQTIPAVVEINTVTTQESDTSSSLPEQRGQGSGFLIDESGHILTNYHVVEGATEVTVVLHDGRTLDAEVLGKDREDDLALVKVDPAKVSGITPLPFADSTLVKPGQMAIALGAPFGLQGSITVGVISGKGRSMTGAAQRPITDMLQTDAAINFGNSGGPLLNSKGEVVGINTAIETSFSQATGIGYVIASNTAKSVLPSLIAGGTVHRPWLGIQGTAITADMAKRLDLPINSGVYVIATTPESPAASAGIQGSGTDNHYQTSSGGDIVTAVDGKPVSRVEDLVSYFNTKQPGDKITLTVIRKGQSIAVEVTLGEWPESMAAPITENLPLPEGHP